MITGGPGVGKTTIVNSVLKILRAKGGTMIALRPDGPRGDAQVEAKTIHRLLEVDPKERRLQTLR